VRHGCHLAARSVNVCEEKAVKDEGILPKQSTADTHTPAPLIPIKRDPHCGSHSKGRRGTSLLSDHVRERTLDSRPCMTFRAQHGIAFLVAGLGRAQRPHADGRRVIGSPRCLRPLASQPLLFHRPSRPDSGTLKGKGVAVELWGPAADPAASISGHALRRVQW
jgi:hypothetical protein